MQGSIVIKSAVLLEPLPHDALLPFMENRSAGFLPVNGKPLIQYWCEHLNLLGIREVHIVVRHFPEQMRRFIGNGERWGLDIKISTIPETMDDNGLLKFLKPVISATTLLASQTCLPVKLLEGLDLSADFNAERVSADQAGSLFQTVALVGSPDVIKVIDSEKVFDIHSAHQLWQANMDMLQGKLVDPLALGFEGEKGLATQVGVQIRPGFKFLAPCSIGRHSMLGNKVFIGPQVVIGSNCIIDQRSRMQQSVIFDDTYIGTHSELNRVMVDGSMVYQVDSDMTTWVDDPAIIGTTRMKKSRVGYAERLMAIILLILALPVILLNILLSVISGKKSFEREVLFVPAGRDLTGVVTYSELPVISMSLSHALWRKIPWLLSVVSGKMHLIGISPVKNVKIDYPLWAKELIGLKPGVINISDVENDTFTEDTAFIKDNYYIATRSLKNNSRLFVRWVIALFKTSAA